MLPTSAKKTRERVLACAGEMGYQVKAKHVSYTKSIVVFIYGSIHYDKVDQFGYEIILGLQAAAAEHGIGVNITAISNAELKSGNYYSIVLGETARGRFSSASSRTMCSLSIYAV